MNQDNSVNERSGRTFVWCNLLTQLVIMSSLNVISTQEGKHVVPIKAPHFQEKSKFIYLFVFWPHTSQTEILRG